MRRCFAITLLVLAGVTHAQEVELDPMSGLKRTGDWEIVRANCIACHSPKLITQQRGSADQWLNMIRWMQAKQNLWQFDAETEDKIVSYLADNYPPQDDRRRIAIPPDLMPPNPYAPPTRSTTPPRGDFLESKPLFP
jgi:hypothetical protein